MNTIFAQDSLSYTVYLYESNNRGFVRDVQVKIQTSDQKQLFQAKTDGEGRCSLTLPINQTFDLTAFKYGYKTVKKALIPTEGNNFDKIEITRAPGYLLESSITNLTMGKAEEVFGVEGVSIEIYNNTTQEEVFTLMDSPSPYFSFHLEQGNEYIFMLRKKGYYTKRLRANVNVNGCILCMEGFGTVDPGVQENLTNKNTMGTLMANIPLKKMVLNETMQIDNIYYDFGKATLRPEVHERIDQLIELMRDNPQIDIELSSHTDSRGSRSRNQDLSQRRANAVVEYMKTVGKIDAFRITAKGYGESQPKNQCKDGVDCTEEQHQENRRTELKIIDIRSNAPYDNKSLASIMQEENFAKILEANDAMYIGGEQREAPFQRRNKACMPEPVPMGFTGYLIELFVDKENPSLDNEVFFFFEKVYLDFNKEKAYSFLVSKHKDKTTAQEELSQLKGYYKKARLIKYIQGKRQ